MSTSEHLYHDYSISDPPHQAMYLKTILSVLRSHGVSTVLDAGCGDGNFTESLAVEGGFRMFGVDLSSGGVEIALKRPGGMRFAVASVYDDLLKEFPEIQNVDAIVSIEVIEHLYHPREFFKRARQALRPGGVLVITTPYWGYLKNIVLALTNRIDRALTALWDGGHIKHWSYRTLRLMGEDQGFECIGFHGAGRQIPFLWKGMVMIFRKN